MEDKSLWDWAPYRGHGAKMQKNDKNKHYHKCDGCVNSTDQEAHDHAPNKPQTAGVPWKVSECWPGKKKKLVSWIDSYNSCGY